MVRHHNRLLVAFYVITDALLAAWAFLLAYIIRFDFGLIPVRKGTPPLEEYLQVLPLVAMLAPMLGTLHNLWHYQKLMADMRAAIAGGTFLAFRESFYAARVAPQ